MSERWEDRETLKWYEQNQTLKRIASTVGRHSSLFCLAQDRVLRQRVQTHYMEAFKRALRDA